VKTYIEEIEILDLWAQLEGQSLLSVDPLRNRKNSDFDKAEKEHIRASLKQFMKLVEVEYKPTQDQLAVIEDRLNYLGESLDRLNRVDWHGIAISTVISISIALSLDTERGKNSIFTL